MPSTVTPAEIRILVDTDLEDPDLQALIDAEEAEMAEEIGPLEGERVELYTFPPARWGDPAVTRIRLRRFTDAASIAEVTDAGVAIPEVDRIYTGGRIYRAMGAFAGPVAIRYTPTDLARIKRAVAERIRWRLVDPTVESESIGSYRYSTGQRLTPDDVDDARRKALERALPPREKLATLRILSATAEAMHYADPRINV